MNRDKQNTILDENRPFRLNYKSKEDRTIYAVREGILCIFFKDDWGWLNVPDEMYDRTWSYIERKGITYIPEKELKKLSKDFKNGDQLLK